MLGTPRLFRMTILCVLLLALASAASAAVYTVTTNADSGAGSLRVALGLAAGNAGPDTVSIGALAGPIVVVASTLNVNSTVILEGNGATLTTAANFDLMALTAGSDDSVIRDLSLQRTANYMPNLISIDSNRNTITHCRIGTDWAGTAAPNKGKGITVSGWGNLIGGDRSAGLHNVISGNTYGVICADPGRGNTICGNIVGLSADQASVNDNNGGISLWGSGNTVGLPQPNLGNIVCSSQQYGIQIYGDENVVQNNLVGLTETGTVRGNYRGLVFATATSGNNLIGGARNSGLHERNVFSGNRDLQLHLEGRGNTVSGNYFNTDLNGNYSAAAPLPEVEVQAILVDDSATGNLIGGSESDPARLYGNVILAARCGIWVEGDGTRITGNRIGALEDGSIPVAAREWGIVFVTGVNTGWVGQRSSLGEGNVIAGGNTGVAVFSGSIGIYGNSIRNFGGQGIQLYSAGNNAKAAPVVTWAGPNSVSGTAASGDFVEVFRAESRPGLRGGSLASVGAVTAMGTTWSLTLASPLTPGDWICATATDSVDNTSPFSINYQLPGGATPTPVWPEAFKGKRVYAFPVPAKSEVHFVLDLDRAADVRIEVFNVNGERAAVLRGALSGSGQSLTWNCGSAGAGVYLARVSVDGTEIQKLKVAVVK